MRSLLQLIAVMAVATGCAKTAAHPPPSSPEPRRPTEQEIVESAIGAVVDQITLEPRGVYENEKLARYVNSVGERVAHCAPKSGLAWHFTVADDPNVFGDALPGARIRLSRGLLAYLSSEAELAAVLAHEIAHVGHGHTLESWRQDFPPVGPDARQLFAVERDRDQERQADALGAEYLACAGYAPGALGRALEALARAIPISDPTSADDPHPAQKARLARLALQADGRSGKWSRERYLSVIDGLPFGESDAPPRLDGSRYVSPGDLSFSLPNRYDLELENSLLTTKRGQPSLLIMRLGGKFWKSMMASALKSEPYTAQSIAGRRVLVAMLGKTDNPYWIALVESARHSFVITVTGREAESRAVLDSVLQSAEQAAPTMHAVQRISIRRANSQQSFGTFLRTRCPQTSAALGSALNGLEISARVRAGTLLKCVGA